MLQRTITVNPAGSPVIRKVNGEKPYTRDDFVRDLNKNAPKRRNDERR